MDKCGNLISAEMEVPLRDSYSVKLYLIGRYSDIDPLMLIQIFLKMINNESY